MSLKTYDKRIICKVEVKGFEDNWLKIEYSEKGYQMREIKLKAIPLDLRKNSEETDKDYHQACSLENKLDITKLKNILIPKAIIELKENLPEEIKQHIKWS